MENNYTYFTIIHQENKILENEFDKQFQMRGNWKKSKLGNLNFLYVDETKYIKNKMYDKKADIKNIINLKSVENVVDKFKLNDNLQKNFPEFAKQHTLPQFLIKKNKNYPELKKEFNKNTWIMKPIDSFAGKGIKIFDNYNNFEKFNKTYNSYVLQLYIKNPLLINGKKFHLRMILLEKIVNNNINTYLLRKGKILTASKKYKFNNFSDKNIHNSHFKSTNEDLIFPDDFLRIFNLQKTLQVFKKIMVICKKISVLLKKTRCYPESKNCFYLFGLDIMVTDDEQVILIECNKKPDIIFRLVPEIVNSIFKIVIDPLYPPKKKLKNNMDYFIKIS